MTAATGDDLDDGLDYSFDSSVEEDEEVAVEALQPLDEEDETRPNDSKRKRVDLDDEDDDAQGKGDEDDKKVKKKRQQKARKQEEMQMVAQEKTALASMEPSIIADYVAHKIRRKNPDLSGLELNELYLNQTDFVSTTAFRPHERDDQHFVQFLQTFDSSLKQTINQRKKSDKLVLVVAMSALRVCDLHRLFKKVPGGSFKLIKKNSIKQDQMYLTGNKRCAVAIATAGRVQMLIEKGILNPKRIQAIVVDCTHLNAKIQNIWDIDDTAPVLRQLVTKSGAKLYLY